MGDVAEMLRDIAERRDGPNCPKPAATASNAVPTTAGSRQPWRWSWDPGSALSAMEAAGEPEGEVEHGEQDEC